jgi:hypothetical protein
MTGPADPCRPLESGAGEMAELITSDDVATLPSPVIFWRHRRSGRRRYHRSIGSSAIIMTDTSARRN